MMMRVGVPGPALHRRAAVAALAGTLCCATATARADTPARVPDREPAGDAAREPAREDAAVPAYTFEATLEPGKRHGVSVYLGAETRAGFLVLEHQGRRWTSRIYPMWWAQAADLDGDGVDELVLGVWSRTRRHDEPSPHRTIWVVTWDGRTLAPLWRGSALARPLADAFAADVDRDGQAELVALERAGQRGCVLTAYEWSGFGFIAAATCPISCDAALDRVARQVRREGRGRRPILRQGRLVLP